MSTTFDVYPGNVSSITAGEFIARTTGAFHDRIRSQGLLFEPVLSLSLRDNDHSYFKDLGGNDPFFCNENEYIWLSIAGVGGGTDIYQIQDLYEDDPEDRQGLIEELNFNGQLTPDDIKNLMEFEQRYYFRRSMGQPGSINILYGIAAGCLAQMTRGLIYSGDGAWDYLKMPMTGERLVNEHMNTVCTQDQRLVEWSKGCWEGLAADLANI